MDETAITKNKKKYTRITHLLSFFKERPQIDPWIWENKTRIGIDVHKAIEKDLHGEFYIMEDEGLNYFESYKRWKKAQDKKETIYKETETRLYDDERLLTGAFDLIISSKDDPSGTLVDFKTCYAVDDVFWPLQGCLYYQLCIKNHIHVSPDVSFVKLDRKGDNPIIKNYTVTPQLEKVVNSLVSSYFYLQK